MATDNYSRTMYLKLVVCIVVDAIGMLTYLLPGIGETFDFAWAPIAAAINFALFRGAIGAVGGVFTLVEELLPADLIPSLTITWFYKYVIRGKHSREEYIDSTKKIEQK
jgi:hypothetical protein